jgi:lipid A 4'-phosphatase
MVLAFLRLILDKHLPWKLLALVIFSVSCAKLDITLSRLFFKDGKFFLAELPLFTFVHQYFPLLIGLLSLLILLIFIVTMISKKPIWGLKQRHSFYLLAVLVAGPVLLVNSILKEFWGRPRPINITEFGGQMNFVPPWFISGQCAENCSFSSGEASGAFWIFAFALLLPSKYKSLGLDLAFLLGCFVSFVRMAQGAHFFTDVMYSGIFVIGFSLCFYYLIFGKTKYDSLLANPPHKERQEETNFIQA